MKRSLWWGLGVVLILAAAAGVGLLVVRSAWFSEIVRQKAIAAIEEVTGGRAELAGYSFDWKAWRIQINSFVLHGKETKTQAPLFSAESLAVGFKVISWSRRDVDLRELVAVKPEIHIYVAEDGSTNLPTPKKVASQSTPVEQVLSLGIDRVELRDGIFEFDSRKMPLAVFARNVQVGLDYEAVGPVYRGHLQASEILVQNEIPARLDTRFILSANRVLFESALLESRESTLKFHGRLEDFTNPHGDAEFDASVALKELEVAGLRGGRAQAKGRAKYSADGQWAASGEASVSGVDFRNQDVQLQPVNGRAGFAIDPKRLSLTAVHLETVGGAFDGSARLDDWRRFEVRGTAQNLDLQRMLAAAKQEALPWNGKVSGPIEASGTIAPKGLTDLLAKGQIALTPAAGSFPVNGNLDLAFSQKANTLRFGDSRLKTADTSVTFRGTLGEHLEVGLFTTNAADLEAVVRLVADDPQFQLPVGLNAGEARFEGSIDGPLDRALTQGHVLLRNATWEGYKIERLETDVRLTRDRLALTNILLAQEASRLSGAMRLAMKDWKPDLDQEASGFFASRNLDLQRLLRANGLSYQASGTMDVTARLEGSLRTPRGEVRLTLRNANIENEKFDRIAANLSYTGGKTDQFQGSLTLDEARLTIGGEYQHVPGDWQNGILDWRVRLNQLDLNTVDKIQAHAPGVGGLMRSEMKGRVEVANRAIRLRSLDGDLFIDGLAARGEGLGDLRLTAKTANNVLQVSGTSGLRNTRLVLNTQMNLTGDYATTGDITFSRLPFRLLTDLAGREPLPVRGFVQGSARFKGPLTDWTKGEADITLDQLRFRPQAAQVLETQIEASELTVQNSGPLRFVVDSKGVRASKAELVAKDTSVRLEGGYTFGAKNPWDTRIAGNVDLAILSTFRPDLTVSGKSTVSAAIRGAADAPVVTGRMEVADASFYLRDIPNGVEQASAVVLFDRNRATIERLTGKTGGGVFEMTGFVGFATKDLVFRLQAKATQVRIRYPEGVSNLIDTDLSLTGSYSKSLLGGSVTVSRTSFNPRSDFASMLQEPSRPVPSAVTRNEFLQGMQFDVRIRTAPNAVFQSAFTNELQAEADLRLRGSPVKPIVLGSLEANQGEVNLFGNKLTVTRGEVLFYNTATIQPSLDFDVETRARGVTVYINVSGPLDRLNINYRSEPPLQTNEIIALLTVGRSPTSAAGLPSSPSLQRGNVLENSPNTLLGGALSSALTSRVEKFFGASRIKIDPQVTGLEGVSQSRLTVEQSVSRDVTVTFSTNLQRTNQQIIAVEWDLSREWAAVATRDENGVFSLEFRLRKRFK